VTAYLIDVKSVRHLFEMFELFKNKCSGFKFNQRNQKLYLRKGNIIVPKNLKSIQITNETN
jgi:hypothetical protein